jgi:hypothetical protein
MQLRPSKESASFAATQSFLSFVRNAKAYYRVHKSLNWPLPSARSIQSIPPYPLSLSLSLSLSKTQYNTSIILPLPSGVSLLKRVD